MVGGVSDLAGWEMQAALIEFGSGPTSDRLAGTYLVHAAWSAWSRLWPVSCSALVGIKVWGGGRGGGVHLEKKWQQRNLEVSPILRFCRCWRRNASF